MLSVCEIQDYLTNLFYAGKIIDWKSEGSLNQDPLFTVSCEHQNVGPVTFKQSEIKSIIDIDMKISVGS